MILIRLYERLERSLTAVEAALSLLASVILFAIMLIVAADVGMRYLLNQPFAWSYDLVSQYLVLAIFYFCLSRGFATHVHVGVDILHYYVSPRVRRLFALIACIVSAPLFAAISAACFRRAWAAFANDDVIAGAIAWPTWVTIVLVPIGTGLLTLRLVVSGAAHLVAIAGGPSLITLPALARSDEGLDQAAFE
jgi:TRAP-type C4-dicarboxylate transport system permease small subunit